MFLFLYKYNALVYALQSIKKLLTVKGLRAKPLD